MTASYKSSPTSNPIPADATRGPAARSVICLEVLRGSTQFPQRPFPIGRFLLGGGDQCDLRLGGAGMPALHSILITDTEGAVVEAVAPSPALRVNGEVRRSSRVQIGDTFAVGGFEFAVRAADSQAEPLPHPSAAMNADPLRNAVERDDELALKSAVELVELIEAEVHHIEDFQSRRQLGAEALLQAALHRAQSEDGHIDELESFDSTGESDEVAFQTRRPDLIQVQMPLPLATSDEADKSDADETQRPVGEIEEIVARLNGFSEQLERRSKRLEEHEAGYLEASLELLKAQQRLADHLQLLQQQIEGLEASHSKALRASA